MDTSTRFLRFAAECEAMAKLCPSPENEPAWHQMADRWIRIADLVERQNTSADSARTMKQHRKPAQSLVY